MNEHAAGTRTPLTVGDVLQWDVATWSQVLPFWAEAMRAPGGPYRCLEVGAGGGGLSLWLALREHEVVCSNVVRTRERAEALHGKFHVRRNISYQDIDATFIPYEEHFDIIVFKSVLGGLTTKDRQITAVDQMYKALKRGGKLLFAENSTATRLHTFCRHRFRHWSHAWRYVTEEEMQGFLRRFTEVRMHATGVAAAFGMNEGQRAALSLLDRVVFNHVCPRTWKYVLYGAATK